MAGSTVGASGALSNAVGQGLDHVGNATIKAGDKLWDFANGDPAKRPPLDHALTGAPPAKAATSAKAAPAKDPSPAEAMKRT
jgi:hypothetical protein